jgi:hypothetical protein
VRCLHVCVRWSTPWGGSTPVWRCSPPVRDECSAACGVRARHAGTPNARAGVGPPGLRRCGGGRRGRSGRTRGPSRPGRPAQPWWRTGGRPPRAQRARGACNRSWTTIRTRAPTRVGAWLRLRRRACRRPPRGADVGPAAFLRTRRRGARCGPPLRPRPPAPTRCRDNGLRRRAPVGQAAVPGLSRGGSAPLPPPGLPRWPRLGPPHVARFAPPGPPSRRAGHGRLPPAPRQSPPRGAWRWRHQGALVAGKRPRVTVGGHLPPAAVILSRRLIRRKLQESRSVALLVASVSEYGDHLCRNNETQCHHE